MCTEVRLVWVDFDNALNPVQDLIERSEKNTKNYRDDFVTKSNAVSVVKYQEVLSELKKRLEEYNTVLVEDRQTLFNIGAYIINHDENQSTEYRYGAYYG